MKHEVRLKRYSAGLRHNVFPVKAAPQICTALRVAVVKHISHTRRDHFFSRINNGVEYLLFCVKIHAVVFFSELRAPLTGVTDGDIDAVILELQAHIRERTVAARTVCGLHIYRLFQVAFKYFVTVGRAGVAVAVFKYRVLSFEYGIKRYEISNSFRRFARSVHYVGVIFDDRKIRVFF